MLGSCLTCKLLPFSPAEDTVQMSNQCDHVHAAVQHRILIPLQLYSNIGGGSVSYAQPASLHASTHLHAHSWHDHSWAAVID